VAAKHSLSALQRAWALTEQEQGSLSFAGLLRRLRGEAKLTQEELAEAAGLSLRAVSDLERGINRTARKDTAQRLAGALGMTESAAALFVAAARGRTSAGDALAVLRGSGQRPAETMPRVWNIPVRNPAFTGRDDLLAAVQARLQTGPAAVVQALHGMGGVGKTQLAAEYAHRFAPSYDLTWWIDAEQDGLIGDQIVSLGLALGCVPAGSGTETARAAVLAELRQRERWLLIFDNAQAPADVAPWLPGGAGHALITSRQRGWDEVAAPIEVDVLTRAESIELLRRRVPRLTGTDANRLAAELGDLPLAIAQTAGFIADTGTLASQYLGLLQTRAGQLLDQGAPGSYPRSLAAATALIADRLSGHDPAAAELASLCAFLAPEPIPEYLFTGAVGVLPGELAARAADPLAWRQTLANVSRQSLARIDHRGLQMHRLTQAILRDRLAPARAAATRRCTEAILAASDPGDPPDPGTWTRWAQLMPHVLAADLAPPTTRHCAS
jgi:transcriptional regulator with XRE-family HTH domain